MAAAFTMLLRDVLVTEFNPSFDRFNYEQPYGEFEYNGVKYGKLPIIPEPEKIGLGTYPIFDEAYRPILNGKIVDNFFTREICAETIDLWTQMMRRRMDQEMPYFNQLYESLQIEYSALDTMRINSVNETDTSGSESTSGSSENTTNAKSKSRAVNSTTPQTMLKGDGEYASAAADTNSESESDALATQSAESENNTSANSNTLVTGYQGTASDLIVKFRNSLINIDLMVITRLEDLFMQILNNGDNYTNQGWYY